MIQNITEISSFLYNQSFIFAEFPKINIFKMLLLGGFDKME